MDQSYAEGRIELLAEHGLKLFAISNHLAGQLVCDPNDDARTDTFAPPHVHGDAYAKRAWAVEAMKNSARTAPEPRPGCRHWLYRVVHLAHAVQLPAGKLGGD